MGIPDYQTIMLPLLKFAGDGNIHSINEAIEHLAEVFNLTDEEKRRLLPSGQQSIFRNRVAWARTYLKKATLLTDPKRSHFIITKKGKEVLKNKPTDINNKFLEQFDEFIKFKNKSNKPKEPVKDNVVDSEHTPEETLELSYQEIRNSLSQELLTKIKSCSPAFFEKLVVQLLVKMGYGGSLKDAGQAIGKSGDEGIDGIIKEDKLGLDIIYLQAKKWENTVPIKEVRDFAGALMGKRAKKGVFITTAKFTNSAMEYVNKIENKIILIDGEKLTDLMIDYNIGVTPISSYEIKNIDMDYFED